MAETEFVTWLYDQFKEAEEKLDYILVEEMREHYRDIKTSGYLVKKYYVSSLSNLDCLVTIYTSMKTILEKELFLREQVKKNMTILRSIERDYNAKGFQKKYGKLKTANLLNYIDSAFFSSKIVLSNVSILIETLKDEKKVSEMYTSTLLRLMSAVENNTNNVANFIKLLGRISNILKNFSSTEYYSSPRVYGRAMTRQEYKKTIKNSSLSASKNPTPVFDATPKLRESLLEKSSDERKNLFRTIGAKGADRIVFFKTNLKPINPDQPIPQSNGLFEYKFPKGIHIEILEAA